MRGTKEIQKNNKGITLIALIITIIVMLLLVTVTITVAVNGGVFEYAGRAKRETELAKEKQDLQIAYTMAKETKKDNKEMFEKIKEYLSWEGAEYNIGSISMTIKTKEGREYTLLADGTLINEIVTYLDIADGTIELYSNGYKQNNGTLVEYKGDYVITGKTTENTVKVMDVGIYNITIKNLSIDVSSIYGMCAFNANRRAKTTDCFVNITLEGTNKLCGGKNAPALGFSGATPNVNGVTLGSTLTISGDGKLDAVGGAFAAGIGSGYTGLEATPGDANNIIINSGGIIAKGGMNGCGIGGGFRKNVNNIVINGGNITAIDGNRFGIGASGILNNLVINGGNINATGGEYGGAIGGYDGSGKITINGGMINATTNYEYAAIGHECETVEINGGTIVCYSKKYAGIYGTEGSAKITGGNVLSTGTTDIGYMENSTLYEEKATDGTNNLYLTPIQLANVAKETKVTSLTTSDNINYGITDMYTSEDDETTTETNEGGILYLYFPMGSRTITIEAEGKKYSGTVETGETNTIVVLNNK